MKKMALLEKIIFGIVLLIAVGLCTMLFYRQIISYPGIWGDYESDLPAHIKLSMGNDTYSYGGKILFNIFYFMTGNYTGIAILMGLAVILTVFGNIYMGNCLDRISDFQISSVLWRWLSLACIFVTAIYVPRFYPYFYRNTLGCQAWHNSTYILMRVFSIPAFGLYLWLNFCYLEQKHLRHMILFGVLIFASTMIKPNFLIGFAPVMAVFLLVDFINCLHQPKKIVNIILFGSMILPAVIVLFAQTFLLFGDSSEAAEASSIMFTMGESYLNDGKPIEKMLFSILFPVVVLACNIPAFKKNRWYQAAWLMFVSNFLIAFFLIESGPRRMHGNMTWGRLFSVYILILVSAYVFCRNAAVYRQKKLHGETCRYERNCLWIEAVTGLAHLGSGLLYWIGLLGGGCYYI